MRMACRSSAAVSRGSRVRWPSAHSYVASSCRAVSTPPVRAWQARHTSGGNPQARGSSEGPADHCVTSYSGVLNSATLVIELAR